MHPSVEKELTNSDKFRDNLERVSFWRLAAVLKNGRYCRESLDKAFALSGHTGNAIFDLWVYVVQALPWFVPATFTLIPGLFAMLIAFISKMLSVVTMEPKVLEYTVEVPVFWFFNISKTITETVMTPVVQAPSIQLATGVAVSFIVIGMLVLSAILKKSFLYELAYRRKLLLKHVAKATISD